MSFVQITLNDEDNQVTVAVPSDGSEHPFPTAHHLRVLEALCGEMREMLGQPTTGRVRIPITTAPVETILDPDLAAWIDGRLHHFDYVRHLIKTHRVLP